MCQVHTTSKKIFPKADTLHGLGKLREIHSSVELILTDCDIEHPVREVGEVNFTCQFIIVDEQLFDTGGKLREVDCSLKIIDPSGKVR
mmetsp:Transcript_24002/g.37386  ORF Transcript_24002/g.37386 Transcript_24002/m.37386 type:complete len:88 (-) Transcript_24002:514-777(-)